MFDNHNSPLTWNLSVGLWLKVILLCHISLPAGGHSGVTQEYLIPIPIYQVGKRCLCPFDLPKPILQICSRVSLWILGKWPGLHRVNILFLVTWYCCALHSQPPFAACQVLLPVSQLYKRMQTSLCLCRALAKLKRDTRILYQSYLLYIIGKIYSNTMSFSDQLSKCSDSKSESRGCPLTSSFDIR